MNEHEISDKLKKILRKLCKKDRTKYEAVMNKIDEVCNSENPDRYKNLLYDLKEFKGVHVAAHFILVFKVVLNKKLIRFEDFRHHDEMYKRN